MDLALVIKTRLEELGLEQKDLAASAQVTESYISQLLARKKIPPLAARTEIYARMSRFLKLPEGELLNLADLQRRERLKKIVGEEASPLYAKCRELILRKCVRERRVGVRAIFEKHPFGELERLVTQTFLRIAQDHRSKGDEFHGRARRARPIVELQSDYPKISASEGLAMEEEDCAPLLGRLIDWWSIDIKTFRLDIGLNRKLFPSPQKRFEFVETVPEQSPSLQPGFVDFLGDKRLSGDAVEEELNFLRNLTFQDKRPAALYYYRELQSLRDPLHFRQSRFSRSSTKKRASST